ncbi:MAG: hypothetical protein IJS50_04940 [Desulfovibrio sp.]|nr:hypothetical protein [Desulfovibrio sp.]
MAITLLKSLEFLAKGRGRLELCLRLIPQGEDYLVQLLGGQAHLGACAVKEANCAVQLITCSGHREGELAVLTAEWLSRLLKAKVCVCAGIHYAAISKAEIAEVESLTLTLLQSVKENLKVAELNGHGCQM